MSNPEKQEPHVDDHTDKPTLVRVVLDRLKGALARNDADKATRIFKEACTGGFIPNDNSLLTWLQSRLGHEDTEKLISVFARLGCYYCENGIITCEECSGHGHDGNGILCAMCLALGISRCDFCGGTGWYTIFHVPVAFQLPVILDRVAAASRDAEALLLPAAQSESAKTPADRRKHAAKALLKLNRCLGVMENMASAAKQVQTRSPKSTELCSKAIATCESVGAKLRDQVCMQLSELSEAVRSAAANATRKAKKQLLERQASLYGDLAASQNFTGTSLHHPLLFPSERALPPDESMPIPPQESE